MKIKKLKKIIDKAVKEGKENEEILIFVLEEGITYGDDFLVRSMESFDGTGLWIIVQ